MGGGGRRGEEGRRGRGGGGGGVPVSEAQDAGGEVAAGFEFGVDEDLDVYVGELLSKESAEVLREGGEGVVVALGGLVCLVCLRGTERIGRGEEGGGWRRFEGNGETHLEAVDEAQQESFSCHLRIIEVYVLFSSLLCL